MSRKRKKNKSAGGSNPSNDLYNHPSVVAARGRKDANTPGGAPKKSKPRLNLRDVDHYHILLYFCLAMTPVVMVSLLSPVQALWTVVLSLINGPVTVFIMMRLARKPWDFNLALQASVIFAPAVGMAVYVWSL